MTDAATRIYRRLRAGKTTIVRCIDTGLGFTLVPETDDFYPRYTICRRGNRLHPYIMLTEGERARTFKRFRIVRIERDERRRAGARSVSRRGAQTTET